MRDSSRWSRLLGLALVTLLVTGCGGPSQHETGDRTNSRQEPNSQVEYLNKKLIEVFGPLPAIASTPFLGLAILTGTALLVEEPAIANSELRLVQQIRQNSLVRQAKQYANWWWFGTFAMLAGLTWLANSGKIRGTLGKFVRIAEDVAVGFLYLMVGADTLMPNAPTTTSSGLHSELVQASMTSVFESSTAILIVAALISLVTMMLTRLALDVLIWLSPVPFIDMIFETGKVLFSLAFLAIYFLLSHLLAAILGLLLLVPCVMLLPWAVRLLYFGYHIVLCPILAQWSPAFIPQMIEPALAQKADGKNVTLACPAWVLNARGLKKRETVTLYHASGQRTVRPRLSTWRTQSLCHTDEEVLLGRAVAWIELRIMNKKGQVVDHYALPLSMMGDFDKLLVLLGAKDGGAFGAMKILHTMVPRPERPASR